MTDMEKVIDHLNECIGLSRRRSTWVRKDIIKDTLTLLKEQQEEIENLKQTAHSMMEGIEGEVKMSETERVVNDLNTAKLILCNLQMLTPEMCIRIGQAITSAIAMLNEQEAIKPTINEYGEAYCICGENVGIIPSSKNLPSVRSKYCSECGRRMIWHD